MSQNIKVQMKKTIKAPVAKVFSAWKDPNLLKSWFAPGALEIPCVNVDFKIGGTFTISMEGEMRGQHTTGNMSGTYKEIVPNERLVFECAGTWRGSAPSTTVTVEFQEVIGGTEITLTQNGFLDENDCSGHKHGWESSFDKLAKFLNQ